MIKESANLMLTALHRLVCLYSDCFEFSVYAGLAKGQPNIKLESIMEIAEFMQKPIGRFQCEIKTEGPTDLN